MTCCEVYVGVYTQTHSALSPHERVLKEKEGKWVARKIIGTKSIFTINPWHDNVLFLMNGVFGFLEMEVGRY